MKPKPAKAIKREQMVRTIRGQTKAVRKLTDQQRMVRLELADIHQILTSIDERLARIEAFNTPVR